MRVSSRCCAIASDVTLCGEVGCGQVVKLINNALVFENTVALAEMMVLGERAGVAPGTLLDAVSKGSGDSFVLRNHGRKAMLPRVSRNPFHRNTCSRTSAMFSSWQTPRA